MRELIILLSVQLWKQAIGQLLATFARLALEFVVFCAFPPDSVGPPRTRSFWGFWACLSFLVQTSPEYRDRHKPFSACHCSEIEQDHFCTPEEFLCRL